MSQHPVSEMPVGVEVAGGLNAAKGEEVHTVPLSDSDAAVMVQKAFRGHRARRELADSSMAPEDLWWQTVYHAMLDQSTTAFFDSPKPESATSRWHRISSHASKVGKGLSRNDSAQKLFFQHWIEAIDPRHRYGFNLYYYYEEWANANSKQPFFYWLDLGDGKHVDLEACPRSKLREHSVKYLSPTEREHYEFVVVNGKLIHKLSEEFMDTNNSKWIFVMSTTKRLYSAAKKKGKFHHSSFLAGGVTLAAGTMEVENGVPKVISAHSGHYRPLEDHFEMFLSHLKDNDLNLDNVTIMRPDASFYSQSLGSGSMRVADSPRNAQPPNLEIPKDSATGPSEPNHTETKVEVNRTLVGDLQTQLTKVANIAT